MDDDMLLKLKEANKLEIVPIATAILVALDHISVLATRLGQGDIIELSDDASEKFIENIRKTLLDDQRP